jgi:hypothetical protein
VEQITDWNVGGYTHEALDKVLAALDEAWVAGPSPGAGVAR